MLSVGDKVPDFALKDGEGKTIKKSDFKGKKYVVYFYPKDFTPGCTAEAAEFARSYKKFENIGIEILGISPDDEESHIKLCEKIKDTFMLLADTETTIANKISVCGTAVYMERAYTCV